jgi:hypothetical protein
MKANLFRYENKMYTPPDIIKAEIEAAIGGRGDDVLMVGAANDGNWRGAA